MKLTKGYKYEVDTLSLIGWDGDAEGKHFGDDFRNGVYLGPADGVEPIFRLTPLIVSGHGGRDAGMCCDGEIVCANGTPYRVVGDHPDGWHVTNDPMARRVIATELDWSDVDEDEIAEDIRAEA